MTKKKKKIAYPWKYPWVDVLVFKGQKHYVATALQVDMVAQGRTPKQAIRNLAQILECQIRLDLGMGREQTPFEGKNRAPFSYWAWWNRIRDGKHWAVQLALPKTVPDPLESISTKDWLAETKKQLQFWDKQFKRIADRIGTSLARRSGAKARKKKS